MLFSRGQRPEDAAPSRSSDGVLSAADQALKGKTLPNLLSDKPQTASACDALPDAHRALVHKALFDPDVAVFSAALRDLVHLGGSNAVKSIAIILSEVVTDHGVIAHRNPGGRHVTVYSLCKALLVLAGASRVEMPFPVRPEQKLEAAEAREVMRFVKDMARGGHGDAETAMGARGLLFERFASLPVAGRLVEGLLHVWSLIERTPLGAPPRGLFILCDLPYRFRSPLPFASTDVRKNNLAEILTRCANRTRDA